MSHRYIVRFGFADNEASFIVVALSEKAAEKYAKQWCAVHGYKLIFVEVI